jgi:hypothetical protein
VCISIFIKKQAAPPRLTWSLSLRLHSPQLAATLLIYCLAASVATPGSAFCINRRQLISTVINWSGHVL